MPKVRVSDRRMPEPAQIKAMLVSTSMITEMAWATVAPRLMLSPTNCAAICTRIITQPTSQ